MLFDLLCYICFTGDLFDNAACTLDASITSRIKLWLESLGTIAPVDCSLNELKQ